MVQSISNSREKLCEKNFIRCTPEMFEIVACQSQCTGEGIDESLSFFINVPQVGDKPAVLLRRSGLDMFKERSAEIPVAPVRPKGSPDAAAPFP